MSSRAMLMGSPVDSALRMLDKYLEHEIIKMCQICWNPCGRVMRGGAYFQTALRCHKVCHNFFDAVKKSSLAEKKFQHCR